MMSTANPSKGGKQMTKGQKQIHEENQATFKYYSAMAVVSAAVYFAVASLLFGISSYEWMAYLFTVFAQGVAVFIMQNMAKATKNDKGQVLDAGLDLNLEGGFGEYCKDVVILASIVQLLSLTWSKFWFLMILIPIFAGYKLWVGILAPWFFAPAPEEEESDDKKAKKRDRRMRKMQ
uniref:Transmembrane protein 208 n=1 Tax=Plectus sambesii TaxID=2011161 RepID=A0A914WMA9_9BILA